MKIAALSLLIATVVALFMAGCASNLDEEDREFFYSGWKNPKTRDTSLEKRTLPKN